MQAALMSAVILTSFAYAQDANAQIRTRSLELSLKSESPKVCLGSFVSLELRMTNHSDRDLEIRQLDLWRNFIIDYIYPDGPKKSIIYGIWPGTTTKYERQRAEIHPLKAKDTYTTTYRFPLGDDRFFKQPGKYTLKVYYAANRESGSVSKPEAASNSVDFETFDCNTKIQGAINDNR